MKLVSKQAAYIKAKLHLICSGELSNSVSAEAQHYNEEKIKRLAEELWQQSEAERTMNEATDEEINAILRSMGH